MRYKKEYYSDFLDEETIFRDSSYGIEYMAWVDYPSEPVVYLEFVLPDNFEIRVVLSSSAFKQLHDNICSQIRLLTEEGDFSNISSILHPNSATVFDGIDYRNFNNTDSISIKVEDVWKSESLENVYVSLIFSIVDDDHNTTNIYCRNLSKEFLARVYKRLSDNCEKTNVFKIEEINLISLYKQDK